MNFLGCAAAAFVTGCAGVTPVLALAGLVQGFLDRLVKHENLPGAVLLVSGPQGRELAASGVANRKTREVMTPGTRFNSMGNRLRLDRGANSTTPTPTMLC